VDLHLDLGAGGGRRAALERALRDAVRSGRLAAGARLPSTRALAAELGLARGTVSAAYDQLVAEGYLSARGGSGTVVASRPQAAAPAPAPVRPAAAPRYDLRPGSPDVTTFPVAAWLRATRRALAAAPASAYDYGDPRGRVELRTALADYLGRTRGVQASPERVVVSSGYVQALGLLATVLGGTFAMEDPCLGLHREVARRGGAGVAPLPVDRAGARTDLLAGDALAGVTAAVLTPAHQFPIGVTLAPARRRAAVDWARAGGGLVVEDDYDGEFRYDRQPVGALQGMAPDQVVYVGSASKTLGPALRLGWLVLPERLVAPVLDAKRHSDLHTGTIDQLALAELIASHAYDRHLRACRLRYRRRRDQLVDRLAPVAAVTGIAAGLHALVRLPDASAEAQVVAAAARRGLAVGGLSGYWHAVAGTGQPAGLVVGFGTPAEGGYPAALDRLVSVLRTLDPRVQEAVGSSTAPICRRAPRMS
jgi:GntR family transcriptional regulator/MocR family aminotransferase